MTAIATPQHGITLGGLVLMQGGQPYAHTGGFKTEVSADGVTWGEPETVIMQVMSALSDGDIVTQSRVGNRTASFYVRISGDTSGQLPLGEKALAGVMGKPVELIWQPPDIAEPPTVFDVLHARMVHDFNDLDELERERSYLVTMTALPWGRSSVKKIVAAVVAAAPTVVNSGSSTSGWSTGLGTLSVVSGAVTTTYNGTTGGTSLTLAGPIDTSTQNLIGVDWKSSRNATHFLRLGTGSPLIEIRREPLVNGWTRSWYRAANASEASLTFSIAHPSGTGTTSTLSIDQVLKANALPSTGTGRQLTSTVTPGGSVTAEGDVIVQHETAGLGQTIVYSHPATGGYSPFLRQWLVSSAAPVTPDAATVSGARNSLVTVPSLYDIPVSALPNGDAQLWVRVRLASGSAAATGINYDVRSVMGGVELDNTITVSRFSLPAAGSGWTLVCLGQITLPPRNLGIAGKVRIYLLRSTVVDMEIDEAWLFGMDEGRLTVVDCGTGTPSAGTVHNRLRVTAPSLDDPYGKIEVATASDWSDAFTPDGSKVLCDQRGHRFAPNGSSISTVTSGGADASVSLEHFPRWHSNAGAA